MPEHVIRIALDQGLEHGHGIGMTVLVQGVECDAQQFFVVELVVGH
jgi:hypothetical protein